MEFVKQNWFYLYAIIALIISIRAFKNINKAKVTLTLDWIAISIFLINTIWMVSGFYKPEKNLFIILLIVTYILPMFYGVLNFDKIDYDKLKNNLTQENLLEQSIGVIKTKSAKNFYSFIFFIESIVIVSILISHYKLAIFYFFNS